MSDEIRELIYEELGKHPLLGIKATKEREEMKEFKSQVTEFLNLEAHTSNNVKMIDDFVRKQGAQVQANAIMMAVDQAQREIG
jgi:hypothetical protein